MEGNVHECHNLIDKCEVCFKPSKAVANKYYHMIETAEPGEIIVIDIVDLIHVQGTVLSL